MPTKRTTGKRRLDHLTFNQKGHLRTGAYLFSHPHPEGEEFENGAHRREAWGRHREALLAEELFSVPEAYFDYDRPGIGAEERAVIEAGWLATRTLP